MSSIEKRRLGNTGLEVTAVGFGALEIGRDWGLGTGEARHKPAEEDAAALLHTALDLSINLLDSASAYHRSEERIGKFVSTRRSEYVLATKCGEHSREPDTYYDFSYEAIRDSIQRSRRLLQTDVIDLLQIHFGPDPDQVLDDGGCVRAMKEAQTAGHVRWIGASVDGPVLDRCIDSGDFQVVQVGYSLLHQGEQARIHKAHERGIGVLIRSGFAGGWLTEKSLQMAPAERPPLVNALLALCDGDAAKLRALALHFLLCEPAVSSVLVGTKSREHLQRMVSSLDSPVDDVLLARTAALVQTAA